MRIIKENSYDIVRLYINQIGITIFSVFLYSAIALIGDNDTLFKALEITVSVFAFLFYVFLVYTVVWEIGAKDKIRVDSGKYERTPAKGFLMGLVANLPNLLFGVLSLIFFAIYAIWGNGGVANVAGVIFLITKFHAAMFLGFVQGVTPSPTEEETMMVKADSLIESGLYIILPMLSVLITHLAYYLGTKDFKIFNFKRKSADDQSKKS